jgi:hypothetical protein
VGVKIFQKEAMNYYLQIESNELPTPWYNERMNEVLTIMVSLCINGEIAQYTGWNVPLTATLHYKGMDDERNDSLQTKLQLLTNDPEIGTLGVIQLKFRITTLSSAHGDQDFVIRIAPRDPNAPITPVCTNPVRVMRRRR